MQAEPTTAGAAAFNSALASTALRAARSSDTPLPGFPGPLPSTLGQAYSVQDLSIAAWPDRVAGWKVGGVSEPFRTRFRTDRLAGPIFSKTVRRAEFGQAVRLPAYRGGFVAIEAEWALEIGDTRGFDPRSASVDQIASVIRSVHTGVEIASSPMPMINELGPAAVVSDFGNNFGLLIGPRLDPWSPERLSATRVTVDINGARAGDASALPGLEGPLGAVRFLLEHLNARGLEAPEGTWVSTGAVTGVHDAEIGAHGTVTFCGLGAFEIELIPIESTGSEASL